MHTRRTHDRTHVHTHAYHDWQDCEQRHAAARRGTEMERRRHSLAHTRALSHEPFHASTAHPSPPIPIITSTSATPSRIYARTHARTLPTRRILHAVIPFLKGKASARALLHLSINLTRPQDSISALSSSFFLGALSCSQGLQYTSSALSTYFLWCGSSCSQGLQEIFSALPLLCSFVSTELPSRLATHRLSLPCMILWVCTEQLSRLPRHLL